MKIRTLAVAAAALSLAASPAIAQASFGRALAPVDGESEVAGGAGLLIGLLGAAAVVGGVLAASSSGNDDNLPVSS